MGLAGGLFLRQAKDHEPCAVPCDTWASGIRELPVEVIAMPSAQRDLSHLSPCTYTHTCTHVMPPRLQESNTHQRTCTYAWLHQTLHNTCFLLFNRDWAWPSCVGFVAISNTAKKTKKKKTARTAYRFRLDLQSSQGKRKDSFMCFCN